MANVTQNTSEVTVSRGTALTGAGAGTLALVVANHLDGLDKEIVAWAAPTISIVWAAIYHQTRTYAVNRLRKRQATAMLEDLRAKIGQALANQHTSSEHRAQVVKQLELLEATDIQVSIDRLSELLGARGADMSKQGADTPPAKEPLPVAEPVIEPD